MPSADVFKDIHAQKVNVETTSAMDSLFINQDADARGIYIDSEATTATNYALEISASQGGRPAMLKHNGNAYVEVRGGGDAAGMLYVYRNLASADTAAPVVTVLQDNTGDDQTAVKVQQDAPASGVWIDHNSSAAGDGLLIDKAAGSGYGIKINTTDGATRAAFLIAGNGPAGSNGYDGYMIAIQNNDTGASGGIHIDGAGTNSAITIDTDVASTASTVYGITVTVDVAAGGGAGAGIDLSSFSAGEITINFPDGNASTVDPGSANWEDGWINIGVAGTLYYIPYCAGS